MRKFIYEYIKGENKIYIKERSKNIIVATYNIDNKNITLGYIIYGFDEVEEILDFIKSYENYQERKKLYDDYIKELFEDDEEDDE